MKLKKCLFLIILTLFFINVFSYTMAVSESISIPVGGYLDLGNVSNVKSSNNKVIIVEGNTIKTRDGGTAKVTYTQDGVAHTVEIVVYGKRINDYEVGADEIEQAIAENRPIITGKLEEVVENTEIMEATATSGTCNRDHSKMQSYEYFYELSKADPEKHDVKCAYCKALIWEAVDHYWSDFFVEGNLRISACGCGAVRFDGLSYFDFKEDCNHTSVIYKYHSQNLHKAICKNCFGYAFYAHNWDVTAVYSDHKEEKCGCGASRKVYNDHIEETTQIPVCAHSGAKKYLYKDAHNHAILCEDCGEIFIYNHTWNIKENSSIAPVGQYEVFCGCDYEKSRKTIPCSHTNTDYPIKYSPLNEKEHKTSCSLCKLEKNYNHSWTASQNGDNISYRCGCGATKEHSKLPQSNNLTLNNGEYYLPKGGRIKLENVSRLVSKNSNVLKVIGNELIGVDYRKC